MVEFPFRYGGVTPLQTSPPTYNNYRLWKKQLKPKDFEE